MKATINSTEVDFSLTIGRKIRGKKNGQDLGDLEKGPIVNGMFLDPESFGRVVWAHYSDRLESAGVESEEAFFDMMDGETFRLVEAAVKEAIADFFPWGRKLTKKVESLMDNMDAVMSQSVPSGQPSGSTPGSSESSPTT